MNTQAYAHIHKPESSVKAQVRAYSGGSKKTGQGALVTPTLTLTHLLPLTTGRGLW